MHQLKLREKLLSKGGKILVRPRPRMRQLYLAGLDVEVEPAQPIYSSPYAETNRFQPPEAGSLLFSPSSCPPASSGGPLQIFHPLVDGTPHYAHQQHAGHHLVRVQKFRAFPVFLLRIDFFPVYRF